MPSQWDVVRVEAHFVPGSPADGAWALVVSSEKLLAEAGNMLCCPLVHGRTAQGEPIRPEPWHVPVKLIKAEGQTSVAEPAYASTKVLIAPLLGEVDRVAHGTIDRESRKLVRRKLKRWLGL